MLSLWRAGILLLLPLATLQRSHPSSLSYIAGVVEYSPIKTIQNGKTPADQNADNYLKFAGKAASYAVDILVFPESSLSISTSSNATIARSEAASYVPDPKDKIIPCNDDKGIFAYSLKAISCAALKHGIYIVVNHREKADCVKSYDCPDDGLLVYNTNVVFDREGRVIARYRKYNLYGEVTTNITSKPQPSTFETDFGVVFGQFICFDILFQTPTLNLTRDLGIRDIIFSTHWFSEAPFLFGIEVQAAWAYANDVNFLASGYNNPETASTGSGIYIGQQGYAQVISENKASNVLVVSEIPKVINGVRSLNINREKLQVYRFSSDEISTTETTGTEMYLHKIDDHRVYTTELIDPKISSHVKTLCDRGLCCEFNVQINFNDSVVKADSNYYRYRLAVFNGVQSFNGMSSGGIQSCGVIYCTNDTLDSCGQLFNANKNVLLPITFKSIHISIRKVGRQNAIFMPTTYKSDMIPLNATDFSFQSNDEKDGSSYHLTLTKPRNDLLTFAIFGRNFLMDGSEATKSGALTISTSPLFTLIIFLIMYLHKLT